MKVTGSTTLDEVRAMLRETPRPSQTARAAYAESIRGSLAIEGIEVDAEMVRDVIRAQRLRLAASTLPIDEDAERAVSELLARRVKSGDRRPVPRREKRAR